MRPLPGLRVLVVEDEGGIALLIEDMLEALGCQVVASVARLRRAFEAASATTFDLAVLDVNLNGEHSFPFARLLRERRIPFIFSTGYGTLAIPHDLEGHVVLTKPFAIEELQSALAAAVGPIGGD